jgi:hypothetical protein
MMAAPVFFCITMILLHPDGWKTIGIMFAMMVGVTAWFNKRLP